MLSLTDDCCRVATFTGAPETVQAALSCVVEKLEVTIVSSTRRFLRHVFGRARPRLLKTSRGCFECWFQTNRWDEHVWENALEIKLHEELCLQIGSLIGKGGVKAKSIREASGRHAHV